MSVIGIVCEFNPFHNGHKYLIDSVKSENDVIVAVMSGNFVQRGEPAIFSKETRVKAALLSGIDIVLELPFVYASASAEYFAFNAVKILSNFGCDKIVFGTENADIESLNNAVDVLMKDNFDNEVKKHYNDGVSFPVARQMAFDKFNINCDISTPNNILAIEYVKAIRKLNAKIIPIAVQRKGAGYNDIEAVDEFASATHIRQLIYNNESFEKFIPDYLLDLYNEDIKNGQFVSTDKFDLAAFSILRSKLNDNLSNVANMGEGLDNRIKSAVKNNTQLSKLYDEIKTKRYTHTRIKRAVLSTILDVKSTDLEITPPYCRVLGFNTKVSSKMGELAKNSKLPFVAVYSDIVNLESKNANRVFELENKSTDFYNLILHNSESCSTEMKFAPIKMQ